MNAASGGGGGGGGSYGTGDFGSAVITGGSRIEINSTFSSATNYNYNSSYITYNDYNFNYINLAPHFTDIGFTARVSCLF